MATLRPIYSSVTTKIIRKLWIVLFYFSQNLKPTFNNPQRGNHRQWQSQSLRHKLWRLCQLLYPSRKGRVCHLIIRLWFWQNFIYNFQPTNQNWRHSLLDLRVRLKPLLRASRFQLPRWTTINTRPKVKWWRSKQWIGVRIRIGGNFSLVNVLSSINRNCRIRRQISEKTWLNAPSRLNIL